jgi:hypothetical protein
VKRAPAKPAPPVKHAAKSANHAKKAAPKPAVKNHKKPTPIKKAHPVKKAVTVKKHR